MVSASAILGLALAPSPALRARRGAKVHRRGRTNAVGADEAGADLGTSFGGTMDTRYHRGEIQRLQLHLNLNE